MFSSKPKFEQSKFKVLLQLATNRLQLQKAKALASGAAHKHEIAELLREGKEEKARVRAMAVIMDDYLSEVLAQLAVYTHTLHARYELLLSQRSCPPDLKECCCAVVFAAPYLADQPELLKCRAMLLARFGKGFPDHCADANAVSPKIVSRLQPKSPDAALVNYYLTAIAKEHDVAGWEPPSLPLPDASAPLPQLPPSQLQQQLPQLQRLGADAARCVAYGPGLVDGTAASPAHFTIEARDATGARRTAGGDRFFVYVSGPENTRIYGEVQDNGDGTYSALYTPPLPGAYAIAVHLDQTAIGTGQPWTVLVGGGGGMQEPATDPAMCRAVGTGLETGVVGEESEFTIFACDATGMPRSTGGDDFRVYVAGPENTRIYGDVHDDGDGTYTVRYTPPLPGGYAIAIHLGTVPIADGRPFELFVDAKEVAPAPAPEDDDLLARFSALAAPVEKKKPAPAPQRAVTAQRPAAAPKAAPVAQASHAHAGRSSGLVASQLQPGIILDLGSGVVKCGIAGDPAPIGLFPTVVGRPMFHAVMPTMGGPVVYVGDEAKRKKGVLSLRYPISRGAITDWADVEAMLTHAFFNELRVDPKDRPVLLTEPARNSRAAREKAIEVLFESMHVPGVFLAPQAALSMRASGGSTGIVLDCGDGTCHSIPVVDLAVVPHATTRLEIGGRDCTDYIIKLLADDGVHLGSTSSERDVAGNIKETTGYVAPDFHREKSKPRDSVMVTYRMPDAEVVRVSFARFMCAEPLFDPHLLGKDTAGVCRMVVESIEQSEERVKALLAANVVLAGGTSMFRGFQDRVANDLSMLMPSSLRPRVIAPENRHFSAWVGGSQLAAQHEAFCSTCVSKAEFDEVGAGCASRFG